ncbi:hypothetical protein HanRHA438_Chr13g0622681 [Helianthus annuus]|nr:hypothetical protein HanRHA438_Chr13g0622681 [Helianthus annuus]
MHLDQPFYNCGACFAGFDTERIKLIFTDTFVFMFMQFTSNNCFLPFNINSIMTSQRNIKCQIVVQSLTN